MLCAFEADREAQARRWNRRHEVILLPQSSESLTVVRSGLQSVRRSERFSGYRRFLTDGRVVSGR